MTRRRWFFVLGLALAAAAAGALVASHGGSLRYSIAAPAKGHLVASVTDDRHGEHTVWVVLPDPPKGGHRQLLCIHSDGQVANGGSMSCDAVPGGTYRYAVYSAEGLIGGSGAQYWTPAHRVTVGQVTVP